MHRHTLAPLSAAQQRVATERDQIRDELEAFESFAERVADIDVQQPQGGPSRSVQRTVVTNQQRTPLQRLRSAFRETVMAVPHFEEVYDEPLLVHVDGELGSDVAASFQNGGTFSEPLKRAIGSGVAQAVERRSTVLEHLDDEIDSLADALSELLAVTETMDELMAADGDVDGRLRDVEDRIRSVLLERQALIHGRRSTFSATGTDLCTYLYGESGGWTYPVLSVTASLQRDADALERRTGADQLSAP
ncbi:hypothetical protein ACFPYI_20075 [Halomarina salina]|uniref:DUF7260 domain-containing protein n=1 Tax=Halomarina salina TaxID=1872699 RepID=A0ABD5RTI2_9EURY|nr:hypothetical protein [Halomarina salina]